jgi:hypothetical protein
MCDGDGMLPAKYIFFHRVNAWLWRSTTIETGRCPHFQQFPQAGGRVVCKIEVVDINVEDGVHHQSLCGNHERFSFRQACRFVSPFAAF